MLTDEHYLRPANHAADVATTAKAICPTRAVQLFSYNWFERD